MDGDANDQNNNPRVWPPAKRAYVFYAKVTLLKANQIPDYLFRGIQLISCEKLIGSFR